MLFIRIIVTCLTFSVLVYSVFCRTIDIEKYFTYDVSTTTKHEQEKEDVVFETNFVNNFKADDWPHFQFDEFTEKQAKAKVGSTSKEKTRCIGPATLMAMCF